MKLTLDEDSDEDEEDDNEEEGEGGDALKNIPIQKQSIPSSVFGGLKAGKEHDEKEDDDEEERDDDV